MCVSPLAPTYSKCCDTLFVRHIVGVMGMDGFLSLIIERIDKEHLYERNSLSDEQRETENRNKKSEME